MVFSFDPNLYVMGYDATSRQTITVPILLPVSLFLVCTRAAYTILFPSDDAAVLLRGVSQGPKQVVETQIQCIDPQGRAGQVLVLLYNLAASAANRYCTI